VSHKKSLKNLFPESKTDLNVLDLVFDSRKVKKGSVFFALVGTHQDGHSHLASAAKAGAGAVVVHNSEKIPSDYSGEVIVVPDTLSALAGAAQKFYDHPESKLKLFGVTGTNGKTTCVYMYEHMMANLGFSVGVMGTIDHHLKSQVWKSSLTTPDVVGVYERLRNFVDLGAQGAAMEVSSHALDQRRVEGLNYDVVLWTNLTRDHLDYHGTEENYFQAKQKLFLKHLKEKGVGLICADDVKLSSVQAVEGASLYRYGTNGDFIVQNIQKDLMGSRFQFVTPFGNAEVTVGTPGHHNILNAAGTLAAGLLMGNSLEKVADSLKDFKGAPGRMEKVHGGPHVFVDYAHTPDALASSLKTLKELKSKDQKLIAVFGFGGDRDRGKRPLMVEQGQRFADHVILTSDNPRTEDPLQILEEGLKGMSGSSDSSPVEMEVDREKAIHQALQMASTNDVILIAGKGHEDYQILGDQILPFSDHKVVREFFR
tara:strand:- start:4434 stop:5882 length:1449 start_codon:yes stop_codon:yes gene_type:complete